MKLGVGVLFVAIGLLVLWLAVTGRLSNVEQAWRTLTGQKPNATPAVNPSALTDRLNIESGNDFSILPTLGFANPSGWIQS